MPWPDEDVGAVVFDMDGVLVDSTALHREVWEEFVADCRWPALRARAGCATGRRSQDVLSEVLGEELTTGEIASIVARLHDDFLRKAGGRRLLFPEAEQILEATTAVVPTALATSAPVAVVRALLGSIVQRFAAVVTAEECSAGKPHPEIYLRACAALGVPPERAVAIEDAPAGVTSAVTAGCCAWGVTAGAPSALLAAGAVVVAPALSVLGGHLLDQLPATAPAALRP
jgi:HAD superfamily hydrolase (TIGR01509 family)